MINENDDKRHVILRDIEWYCNITRNRQVFSLLPNGDIGDIKFTVQVEVIFTLCPPLCFFMFRVKAVKPKSDGSETEVIVQYHLQKQDCQLLAASETGDTENRLFLKWNLASRAQANLNY